MMGLKSGALPSTQQHSFSQVPKAEIPRSSFNRSHGVKTTFNAGYLVPVFVDEALPGDTFNLKMQSFARLATPIVPFMDNLYCDSSSSPSLSVSSGTTGKNSTANKLIQETQPPT